MINRFFLPSVVLMLAAGCSSLEKKFEALPTVGFDLVEVTKTPSKASGKVTFLVMSAGTDVWLVTDNGTRNFVDISNVNVAGTRCSYASRNTSTLAPGSVTTFKLPTVGLLGLCYTNEDQMMFINNPFANISESSESNESLPMYFSADYIFPGVFESESNTFTKSLMLNFIHKELK